MEEKLLSIQALENTDKHQTIYSPENLVPFSGIPIPAFRRSDLRPGSSSSSSSRTRPVEPRRPCWRLAESKGPFDLHKFLDEFCHWYDGTIDREEYCLTTSISPDLPRFFQGKLLMLGFLLWDIARYSQVYLGSGGDVRLEVHCEPFSGNWCSISFSLMVPGLGIPLEQEKMLFLPVDSNRKKSSRTHASTNLHYAGKIAGLFGGRLHVHNNIGFGVEYNAEICLLKQPD